MGLGGGVPGHESRPHAIRTEDGVNGEGGCGGMAWLEGRGFVLGWIGDAIAMGGGTTMIL